MNNGDISDNSSSRGNTDTTENYIKRIVGNNGNKYNLEVLNDLKNNFLNIDMLIIDELYDYESLYLEVRTWNDRARACYEKAGFEIVGKPYLRIIENKPVIFHEMRKIKLEIPELVKQRALSLGELGEQWLKNIHSIVNVLKSKWNISIEMVQGINTGRYWYQENKNYPL